MTLTQMGLEENSRTMEKAISSTLYDVFKDKFEFAHDIYIQGELVITCDDQQVCQVTLNDKYNKLVEAFKEQEALVTSDDEADQSFVSTPLIPDTFKPRESADIASKKYPITESCTDECGVLDLSIRCRSRADDDVILQAPPTPPLSVSSFTSSTPLDFSMKSTSSRSSSPLINGGHRVLSSTPASAANDVTDKTSPAPAPKARFTCEICSAGIAHLSGLSRHMRNLHGMTITEYRQIKEKMGKSSVERLVGAMKPHHKVKHESAATASFLDHHSPLPMLPPLQLPAEGATNSSKLIIPHVNPPESSLSSEITATPATQRTGTHRAHEKKYTCGICDVTLTLVNNLSRHLKQQHGLTLSQLRAMDTQQLAARRRDFLRAIQAAGIVMPKVGPSGDVTNASEYVLQQLQHQQMLADQMNTGENDVSTRNPDEVSSEDGNNNSNMSNINNELMVTNASNNNNDLASTAYPARSPAAATPSAIDESDSEASTAPATDVQYQQAVINGRSLNNSINDTERVGRSDISIVTSQADYSRAAPDINNGVTTAGEAIDRSELRIPSASARRRVKPPRDRKRYTCAICGAVLTLNCNLSRHMKTLHGVTITEYKRLYEGGQKDFSRENSTEDSKTPTIIMCHLCQNGYNSQCNFERHMRMIHGSNDSDKHQSSLALDDQQSTSLEATSFSPNVIKMETT